MDYISLVNQIQAYANRFAAAGIFTNNNQPNYFLDDPDKFIQQIPNFINQGINRIYNEAKNIGFQVIGDSNLLAGVNLVNKPLNWKETISFQSTNNGVNTFLLPRTYEFCIKYWPVQATQAAPLFYADYNLPKQNVGSGQFYIVPTPDMNYAYTLTYLELPLFNAQNTTNFLTDRFPNLLLYACMTEAAPFLKDDERVPVFESYYNRALQNINRETTERYTDRTSKRDKD